MDVHQAIIKRRTIHSFTSKPVPHSFILKAIEAANYAPCHKLTYPWRFTIVSEHTRASISSLALMIKANGKLLDEKLKSKILSKFNTPSHLIIVSQVLSDDPKQKLED